METLVIVLVSGIAGILIGIALTVAVAVWLDEI